MITNAPATASPALWRGGVGGEIRTERRIRGLRLTFERPLMLPIVTEDGVDVMEA